MISGGFSPKLGRGGRKDPPATCCSRPSGRRPPGGGGMRGGVSSERGGGGKRKPRPALCFPAFSGPRRGGGVHPFFLSPRPATTTRSRSAIAANRAQCDSSSRLGDAEKYSAFRQ